MPPPAEGVDEARVARWLKQDGDVVAVGDEILEIETDKVTIGHVAEAPGVLRILVPEGATVPVGSPIARLVPVTAADDGSNGAEARPDVGETDHVPERGELPAVMAIAEQRELPDDAVSQARGIRATPLARLIARRTGVDLASVAGTGPYGLVTRADVPPSARTNDTPTSAEAEGRAQPPPSPGATASVELLPLSRVQEVIARRMVETKTTVPDFQVQTDAVVDEILAIRARLKDAEVVAPSVNDFVIKAAALALREHPRVNASFREDGFVLHQDVNVGFAVAADDALHVATVRSADTCPLLGIAAATRRLTERIRSGTFGVEDVTGATFTVSNLGMFGMTQISPVINAPQAAIMGVGAARAVPQIDGNGKLVAQQVMTLTLTCDHRILYGADAARFLSRVRSLLEQPLVLLVSES